MSKEFDAIYQGVMRDGDPWEGVKLAAEYAARLRRLLGVAFEHHSYFACTPEGKRLLAAINAAEAAARLDLPVLSHDAIWHPEEP